MSNYQPRDTCWQVSLVNVEHAIKEEFYVTDLEVLEFYKNEDFKEMIFDSASEGVILEADSKLSALKAGVNS